MNPAISWCKKSLLSLRPQNVSSPQADANFISESIYERPFCLIEKILKPIANAFKDLETRFLSVQADKDHLDDMLGLGSLTLRFTEAGLRPKVTAYDVVCSILELHHRIILVAKKITLDDERLRPGKNVLGRYSEWVRDLIDTGIGRMVRDLESPMLESHRRHVRAQRGEALEGEPLQEEESE